MATRMIAGILVKASVIEVTFGEQRDETDKSIAEYN
jgi:hypothetical protein